MRLLFIMDGPETIHPDKDTTFAFIRGAERRGHESYHALLRDIYVAGGEVRARARKATTSSEAPYLQLGEVLDVALGELSAVLIRKDPPFDADYLYCTLLLEHARGKTLLINDPRGLRDANEKLYSLNFPEFTPRTIVTADRDRIHAFTREVGGKAVIKPLHLMGGFGVLGLNEGDKNARAIVDMLTNEGKTIVMVQEFIPKVVEGDKRILILDGEPLGAILRVPRADDLRSNIHVGGSVVPTELTPREHEMVKALAPKLKEDGLVFVGLDVIGERLTEVNVTSPTGIQELARHTNSRPEEKVIEWIEKRATR